MQRLQSRRLDIRTVKRATPFAFPLLVERFRESLSSEKLADRIRRMVADLEQAAGPGGYQDSAFAIDDERPAPRKGRSPRQGKDGLPRPPAQRPKKRR
ncbi:ATP-dependent helicase Lhr and Lhr-like helicase [Ectopseudomonas guguanensis]|uniref:ATP-dependent helicase Lhr and Lhr-like helicase n=1 Tax=Ectopseudomonas guguanensis TaxID=1198456 RepID=A0A1H0X6V1_9GAMM|nr:ATP-dependent helicase Lhr and Lhr-like helicase [Pseudomonas guguanensis]